MGFFDRLKEVLLGFDGTSARPIVEQRLLDVPSGSNYRDLGGYDVPGGKTAYRRFVRTGSTSYLTDADLSRLEAYGICRVLDLRSSAESPRSSDRFARRPSVEWLNIPLFDYDLSDPKFSGAPVPAGNYLIDGYVTMLSNSVAWRRIFEFFASTPPQGGVLFHCAAGMDRTGLTAMLLLSLVGVPRRQIVADYLYSFAPMREVDRVVFEGRELQVRKDRWNPLPPRLQAIEFCLDRLEEGYGTARDYLRACGVGDCDLDTVSAMLMTAPVAVDGSDA